MKLENTKTILLERELSDLDLFVIQFVNVLEKHASYVLISGYVAILFGRSRGTEDVDLLIEKITKEQFSRLYKELLERGFWSLNADAEEELFSMLNDGLAIRFAEKGKVVPNMEVKFVKDLLDALTLKERITVKTEQGNLFIGPLELQIAYKRFVLKSQKDLEDAQHLQKWFKISEQSINNTRRILQNYGRC